MPIDLYMHPMSSPCRAVLITAEQLGIKFNKKIVDVLTGEQFTPEYMKINPQHCVPTINDDGFFLWERAILKYLVNQYAPNSLLYPKNPKIRATVDRLLYFDIDVLYKAQQEVLYPTISKGETADSEKQEAYKKALEYLEMFLSKTAYVAGNSVTIADYSILASITSTEVC
ncbi:glutathione S-transferase 2 isoform X2 [Parasteatoda tepidariorum]|uniref:glutathione S-transferase 2 isoform X2 n=1 Tax=Parasteatoda tepidariorum TaxID=114398 RepID=UPI0039BCBDAE